MKEEEFDGFTDEEVEKILKEALTLKLKEKRKVPNKVQLNQALVGTMSEFLTCFRLMGYDLNGDPVNLMYCKEKMEKSALDNLFMDAMTKFMSSRLD